MYAVEGTTIKMTRGDTVEIEVEILRNGDAYTPQEGDAVRFAMKRAAMNSKQSAFKDAEPLVVKAIPTDTMVLRLDPEDTKPYEFGEYAYDMQITFANGKVSTFIADARLVLMPEVD